MTMEPSGTLEIGDWPDAKAAFLSRIAATTGTLKILLKTKDDHHLLERWITHHANIVGLDNLVIFDNMSVDTRVHRIYQKYQSRVPIIRFTGHYDSVHFCRTFPALYSCLKESCEFFTFLDTDEFLFRMADDTYVCDGRLLDFLHSRPPCDVIPGIWLLNVPGSDRRFRTGRSLVDFVSLVAWGKPIVRTSSFVPDRPGHMNHNVDIDGSAYRGRIGLDCFVAHLKNLSAEQRIEANINKLIANRVVGPHESLESIVRRDLDDFSDAFTRRLAIELRELTTPTDAPRPSDNTANDSWLELAPHGRVLYSGEQQSSVLRAFQTNSQGLCRAVLQADGDDVRRNPDPHWRQWRELVASNPTAPSVRVTRRTPVCVAGMPGTDTSMIARILGIAGVHFGEPSDFSHGVRENRRDPWQDPRFVAVNDRILQAGGGGWDHPAALPAQWSTDPRFAPLAAAAKDLLAAFVDVPSWGWHDPRNSLTLPFWHTVAGNLRVILCLRDPLEVVASLSARYSLSTSLGLHLWTAYTRQAIAATRPEDRLVTHYDAYFDSPTSELRRLFAFVGLDTSDEAIDACRTAVSDDLRHHRVTPSDDMPQLPSDVVELYDTLLAEAGRPPAGVRRVQPHRLALPVSNADVAVERDQLKSALEAQAIVIDALRDELEEARRTLEEIEESILFNERLNDLLDAAIPLGATVLVVSQGDDTIVRLSGRRVWHFPHTADGAWNGNPATSEDAIEQLDAIRAQGRTFLVLPVASFWWLEYYHDLNKYLHGLCRTVVRDEQAAVVFELAAPDSRQR